MFIRFAHYTYQKNRSVHHTYLSIKWRLFLSLELTTRETIQWSYVVLIDEDKKQNKKRLDVNFYPIYLDQYMWHDHEEIRILLKCERTAGGNLKKKGLSCQRLFDE